MPQYCKITIAYRVAVQLTSLLYNSARRLGARNTNSFHSTDPSPARVHVHVCVLLARTCSCLSMRARTQLFHTAPSRVRTHASDYSLTHPFTRSLTKQFSHLLIHSLARSLTNSPTNLLTHILAHLLTHSPPTSIRSYSVVIWSGSSPRRSS